MHPHKHHPEPLGATVHAAAAAAVRAALPAHRPPSSPPRDPIFHIGGGGIFFWWQTGVLRELQGLERFALRGASAGALAATLTACNVDPGAALDRAHALALQHRVFERPLGLVGVWGGMVRAWLEELLPDDAGARCSGGRVQIVVTRWPWLQRWTVSEFQSKREVVEACMASVHVPLLLDGRLTANFRGQRAVDGALLDEAGEAVRMTFKRLYKKEKEGQREEDAAAAVVVHLRCSHDAELARRGLGFFKVRGIEDVHEMMELGAAHGRSLGAVLEAAAGTGN